MGKYKAWHGRMLMVDLTTKAIEVVHLPDEYLTMYLGGGGANTKLLFDYLDPHVDPLSPDNIIIFGVGPLVGTTIPSCSRFTVTTKSPLTGIFADSNAGGFFGVELKKCGFDHLLIKGSAKSPVYLSIAEGEPQILPADELWGKDHRETDRILHERHGDETQTARIGIAGENLVKFACVITSHPRPSFLGRTGVGAVWGVKKLKAIVVKGHMEISVADPYSMKVIREHLSEKIKSSISCQDRAKNGTLNVITGYNATGTLWKENHRDLATEEEGAQLEPDIFLEKFFTKKQGCYRCPLRCSLAWSVKNGDRPEENDDKVEFGHIYPLGVNLGLFNYPDVLHLSKLSNDLGLDSVELGYTLSFAAECFEKGIITPNDTGGFSIEWGDVQSFEFLINKIASREAIGNILAEGTKRAGDHWGNEAVSYALNIKGLGYGPEKSTGWTLGLLTSTRGGDHLKSMAISMYAYGLPHMMDTIWGKKPESTDAYNMDLPACKGRYIWWHENYKAIVDAFGLCIFPYLMLVMEGGNCLPNELNTFFFAATGVMLSDEEICQAAERIYILQKVFNAELGICRKDDILQKRPVPERLKDSSPFTCVDASDSGMLEEYYRYRGCTNDGVPTAYKMRELNLEQYILSVSRGEEDK